MQRNIKPVRMSGDAICDTFVTILEPYMASIGVFSEEVVEGEKVVRLGVSLPERKTSYFELEERLNRILPVMLGDSAFVVIHSYYSEGVVLDSCMLDIRGIEVVG